MCSGTDTLHRVSLTQSEVFRFLCSSTVGCTVLYCHYEEERADVITLVFEKSVYGVFFVLFCEENLLCSMYSKSKFKFKTSVMEHELRPLLTVSPELRSLFTPVIWLGEKDTDAFWFWSSSGSHCFVVTFYK